MHPRGAPDPIVKKTKPTTGRGTVLEGWLDRPCKIHTTPDTVPTHNLRACWILRQVAKSGEDLLTKKTPEQHPAKRMHPRGAPDPIVKKTKPTTGRGTVLEGWLDRPCKIHTTPDTVPTHNLRACWILRQVAKSGEDLLTKKTPEQHPPGKRRPQSTNGLLDLCFKKSAQKGTPRTRRSLPNCSYKPLERHGYNF